MEKYEKFIVKNGIKYKLVAPQGGWGYMICVSVVLQFLCMACPTLSFGIIYNDFLNELGEGTSSVTLFGGILSMSFAISGFVSNAILKRLSLRQVSILGSAIYNLGTFLTIFVRSVPHLIITNGILQAIGTGLVIPVAYTSFNSYFTQRKLVYLGATKVVIGIGNVVAPLVFKYSMEEYGFRGTLALIFGFGLHSMLASVMLQPVEWHLKMVELNECEEKALLKADEHATILEIDVKNDTTDLIRDNEKLQKSEEVFLNQKINMTRKFPKRLSIPSYLETDSKVINDTLKTKMSISCYLDRDGRDELACRTSAVNLSNSKENYEVTVVTKNGLSYERLDSQDEQYLTNLVKATSIMNLGNLTHAPVEPFPPILDKKGRLKIAIDYFDLSLLKDVIYTNTCLGMAICLFSDGTYFMLMPLFLYNSNWNSTLVSRAIALQAIGDMMGRLSLVIVSKMFHVNSRYLFLAGMISSVLLRIVFNLLNETVPMLVIITAMGFTRCCIHITQPVIVAECVPIRRYPAAFGLFMLLFGIANLIGGLIVGYIRDSTGSYPVVFNILTGILVICAVSWMIELCICRRKKTDTVAEITEKHKIPPKI